MGFGPIVKTISPPFLSSSKGRNVERHSFPFSATDWMYTFRSESRSALTVNVFQFERWISALATLGLPIT